MRKNKIKSIFIILILFSGLIFGFATTPVMAVSVYSLDYGWESLPSGTKIGNSGFIDFESDYDSSWFQTDGTWSNTGVKSFKVSGIHGTNTGWWNLTQSFGYITSFSWYGKYSDTTTSEQIEMHFYNGDDMIIRLLFDGNNDKLMSYGVTEGWNTWDSVANEFGYPSDEYYVNISHNHTNWMIAQLYNNTDLVVEVDFELSINENWETFDRIEFNVMVLSSGDNNQYFDDFNITTDDPPAGQGEGDTDLDNYYVRCSTPVVDEVDYYSRNISSYIQSIEDISIQGVELIVSDDQISLVTGDKTKYYAWVNGVALGTADYIFQDMPATYKIQWSGFDIDIGNNDVILEFKTSIIGFGAYWNSLPVGYTDSGKSGGVAGDGYFDGTDMVNGYAPATCIYYTLTDEEDVENTYTIDLLSVDPHWRGNVTEFRITVSGSDSWTYVIQNPAGYNVIEPVYFSSGGNAFDRTYLVPSYVTLGEYTIYAMDLEDYPNDLETGANVTFNVSDYGGNVSYWFIEASTKPIIQNTFQGITYFVPDGKAYSIRFIYNPTDEATYIKEGVGDGEIHTIPNAMYIDKLGRWYVILQCEDTDCLNDWSYWRDSFDCVETINNYIAIGAQGDYICNIAQTTVKGFYDGQSGTLWIKKNDLKFKSYPIFYGDFEKIFNPDDDENGLGIYQVFITNNNGTVLSWSEGLSIEVYFCELEPEPDDEGEDWYGLPYWVQYLIGIFLTLFITMSPLIIGTYISRNTRMTKVSIPPLLYVGFFFFGLVVSVLMDFLPSWLPFVILFGMITFFAVQWLYGKKGEIAGE